VGGPVVEEAADEMGLDVLLTSDQYGRAVNAVAGTGLAGAVEIVASARETDPLMAGGTGILVVVGAGTGEHRLSHGEPLSVRDTKQPPDKRREAQQSFTRYRDNPDTVGP
jgi:hypothetical protein